jgi:iron complex outermembrane receptor protein
MPQYTTADLFWSRTFGKLEAKATIKNLTGSRGATYGGYSQYVSLPAGGSVASYYYYPSDPRSVFFSMEYQF